MAPRGYLYVALGETLKQNKMSDYTPFKMKGHSLPGINQKNNKDHNPTNHFLEKKPNPTVKAQKSKSTYNEKEEQTIENMSNAKDNNFNGHMEMQIKKDEKAHNIAANITEGSIESQALLRKKNAGGKKKPMFPPTREGSKQRSAAEKALEATEDAEGK